MAIGGFLKNNPGALGELQQNQQETAPRPTRVDIPQPKEDGRSRSRSPTKSGWANFGSKSAIAPNVAIIPQSRDASPKKPKKQKSTTNIASFLSRPKSLKNLHKLATDSDITLAKDKENRGPNPSSAVIAPTPIFAQFTSDDSARQPAGRASIDYPRDSQNQDLKLEHRSKAERPKSYQVPPQTSYLTSTRTTVPMGPPPKVETQSKPAKPTNATQKSKLFGAFSGLGHTRAKSTTSAAVTDVDNVLDPKDIDKHLEAMLNRRNIPENQRYKMRNLNDTIKMEFIRQDWAEMQAVKSDRPGTNGSMSSLEGECAVATGSDGEQDKQKRSRGKSFTFARGRKEAASSTKKSKGDGTLGRHFRSKSTESIVTNGDRPTSSDGPSGNNFLSKMKLQQGPMDYVAYLRKVQKPQLVEVGKLHKLRLLLRNETVTWIEDFIDQGGMMEIVGLLKRIMEVEWREEHEDALLHENLLCLKALSTTARAMQYLHTIQADLFPKLLAMLFDPERKGPSEFNTRNIITAVLFRYIESAPPTERMSRARSILDHLRDPEPKENERPLPFVMEMRQQRPYRVWGKEVVNVTKEVFWIFLHNLNVVALPDAGNQDSCEAVSARHSSGELAYQLAHFPHERPPVPAAPYVGGVEWDATNYLASHLDLLNAILACIPTASERNLIRAQFRISGWERCLGGNLRLCKEKFYGSVHDGLRTWVAAAVEDGWDVRDVRYGPAPEARSSPKKMGGGQKKAVEEAPKLDLPKLSLGTEKQSGSDDAWL